MDKLQRISVRNILRVFIFTPIQPTELEMKKQHIQCPSWICALKLKMMATSVPGCKTRVVISIFLSCISS